MITLSFPYEKLRSQAEDSQRKIRSERPQLLKRFGGTIEELARDRFEILSHGGSDSEAKWKPLTAARLKRKIREGLPREIGVASGKMRTSLRSRVIGSTVTVEYDILRAVFFASRRPLFPKQLPSDWEADLEQEAIRWSDDILVTSFQAKAA